MFQSIMRKFVETSVHKPQLPMLKNSILGKNISFQNSLFSWKIIQRQLQVEVIMCLSIPQTTTHDFPQTLKTLKKHLPAIYNHKCRNGEQLPFCEEVVKTELGHLFEHILMEYLHQLKSGQSTTNYIKGETIWDWTKDARGTFHILIDSPKCESTFFFCALEKATALMIKILAADIEPASKTGILVNEELLPYGRIGQPKEQ